MTSRDRRGRAGGSSGRGRRGLRFHLLGPMRVIDDRQVQPTVSRPGWRHLLAAFLLQPNQVIPPGRLAGLLWDDARARRVPELRTLVWSLRAFPALSQRLQTLPGGYRFEVRPGELDLERFRLLAGQGGDALAGGRHREAARLLDRSLELWEDPPLADLPETVIMQRLAAELLEERHAARLDLAEALLALGRHRALVPHLLAQAGERPADERAWEFLVIALYRSGRRADALDAFRGIARTLRDEYGIDPGPRLRRVHQDILHDRAPGPPARPVRSGIPMRTPGAVTISVPPQPAPAASHIAGTNCFSVKRGYPLHSDHAGSLIGYACCTGEQDLTAQRQRLAEFGVADGRIYLDYRLTGRANRKRPGLDQALATARRGDALVVPELGRLARSVPDARAIGDSLVARGVKLSLGGSIYDPEDPMGKMFFNALATFAEFEAGLLRLRAREGMAAARAKGKLRGRQPKLSPRQQAELRRMHATGDYSVAGLAGLFTVSRPTVYRTLQRDDRSATSA